MTIIVIGSVHVDFYVIVSKFPKPGETVLGYGYHYQPGGKGANQAIGCGRLGVKTYMVGKIGNDFKDLLIENFKRNNVITDYISIDEKHHTGVAFIILHEKTRENMIFVDPGADYYLIENDIDRVVPVINESKIVLLQMEIPFSTNIYAARKAKELGKIVILNPAPMSEGVHELIKLADIVTPNKIEAEYISGVKINDLISAVKAGKRVLKYGLKHVVITLGSEGSVLITQDKAIYYPSFRVQAVDTTGAGDAFNAGFAVALSKGVSIEEAVIWGNAVAALKITKIGAQTGMPWFNELLDFLEKNKDYAYRRLS